MSYQRYELQCAPGGPCQRPSNRQAYSENPISPYRYPQRPTSFADRQPRQMRPPCPAEEASRYLRRPRPPDERVYAQQARAAQERGPQQRGPQQREPQQREPQQRGPQQREPQQREPQQREPQQRGPQQREPQQREPQQRAPQQRAPQQRAPQPRGPQQEVRMQRAMPRGQPMRDEQRPAVGCPCNPPGPCPPGRTSERGPSPGEIRFAAAAARAADTTPILDTAFYYPGSPDSPPSSVDDRWAALTQAEVSPLLNTAFSYPGTPTTPGSPPPIVSPMVSRRDQNVCPCQLDPNWTRLAAQAASASQNLEDISFHDPGTPGSPPYAPGRGPHPQILNAPNVNRPRSNQPTSNMARRWEELIAESENAPYLDDAFLEEPPDMDEGMNESKWQQMIQEAEGYQNFMEDSIDLNQAMMRDECDCE